MSDASAAPLAAISIRQTTPTMKWLGKTCPKCQKEIVVGDQVVLCPKCYTPQHAQCWRDNGNQCAIDQTPARIIEPRGRPAAAASADGTGGAPTPTPPTPSADTAAAAAPAAARPAAPVAAAPAAAAAAPAGQLADPWRYALPLNPPPESDLWRRNIMTIFWIVVIWAIFVAIAYFTGFAPGR
jgi:hypothetical protein